MTSAIPAFAALLALAGLGALAKAGPAPWLINETPSLPRGVYLRTTAAPGPGALVAVAPPAAARAYLASLGARPQARLLKRVAAGPGEVICRQEGLLTWPRGARLARASDRRGRPLPGWTGCRALRAGEFLVVGDTAASFDSRYFGPVRASDIQGVYREIWRW